MLIRRCALFAAIPANCRRENPDCPRRPARQYSIAELCCREDINTNVSQACWSKEFLEAGKKRLSGDTVREATSDEVKTLRAETASLKEALADVVMENRLLKKSIIEDGENGI